MAVISDCYHSGDARGGCGFLPGPGQPQPRGRHRAEGVGGRAAHVPRYGVPLARLQLRLEPVRWRNMADSRVIESPFDRKARK